MKLKLLLARHGVTQTELAKILGRDRSVITHLFQGKRLLKADEAILIASHLGVPVAEILGADHDEAGFAERYLIPFQYEPLTAQRHKQVVKQDERYFLRDETGLPDKCYALEVKDESMNMAGVMPGDIVISQLDRPCKKGDLVVAQHYQMDSAETVIRRFEPPFLLAQSTHHHFMPLSCDGDLARAVSPVIKLIRLM